MNGTELDAPPVSSPGTDSAADAGSAQVAPEVTTASTGDQADQTPTAADELAEFKADVAKAAGDKPADLEVKPEAEAAEAKPTDEPAAAETDKDKTPEALSQDQAKVPEKLTERAEWKTLTAIADKLGPAAGKETRKVLRDLFKTQHDLQTQVEQFKPATEVVQEMMASVGGSDVGFKNMRHLIKSFDQDPAGAIPMLETLIADAKKRAGVVVSAPELLTKEQQPQKQYDDGEIDHGTFEQRRAELLELQQARLVTEQAKRERETVQQRQTEAQQQAAITALNQAEQAWVAEKQKSDPDYPALKSLADTFIQKNVVEFADKNKRWPNEKEANDLLETSYRQAKTEAMKFRPKPQARQAIKGGEGSSGNNRQQPATELDEFKMEVERSLKRHR